MEVWTLAHPTLGEIKVERGYDAEFRELYPNWPKEPTVNSDGQEKPFSYPEADARLHERIRKRLANPRLRLQISVDGHILRRMRQVPHGKIALTSDKNLDTELSSPESKVIGGKPYLEFHSNFCDDVLAITYHSGEFILEFDPPAGSRGEKRARAMEKSQIKRVLFPLVAGMGKAGWAIIVFVVLPILAKLLPDWEINIDLAWPKIHLPTPHLSLPKIHWPQVDLPVPHLHLHLPKPPELPDWLLFLIDHPKMWVPIIAGLFFGIRALRNHKKSEATKERLRAERESLPDSRS